MSGAAKSNKVRVFLVDDHPIVRRGFQLLIGLEPDLAVCGEADSASVALQKIVSLKPDVAIVDLSLKSGSGMELIKQLHKQLPRLKILTFTMWAQGFYAERALRAGASGYVTKEEGTERAIEGIRLLTQGKTCLSPVVAEYLVARVSGTTAKQSSPCESLSDRELEILQLLGNGLGSREIAQNLHLSIKTVESHREHIKTKLALKRASQLVNYAHNWVRGS